MSDVVVVGAGVVGLAVAWRAAQAGASVTVLDDAPGTGASRAAAGMLAPVSELAYGEQALLALGLASRDRWPAFAADLQEASGLPVPLRREGTLLLAADADGAALLADRADFAAGLGVDVERLLPSACRAVEPSLSSRLRGGLRVADDASVDPRAVHVALRAAAAAAGVRLLPQRATALEVHDGRAAGVQTGGSVLRAETVVLAAGAASGRLPAAPRLPVRPVKGQVLRLSGPEPLLGGTVRALVRGREVYLVPQDGGRLVVGATVEERGDDDVTAGAVLDLLRDAADVVPDVVELVLDEALARCRPGTPDNLPLLGESGLPGLLLATGHHRGGVLLAPLTADALVAVLQGRGLPAEAAACRPDREEVRACA